MTNDRSVAAENTRLNFVSGVWSDQSGGVGANLFSLSSSPTSSPSTSTSPSPPSSPHSSSSEFEFPMRRHKLSISEPRRNFSSAQIFAKIIGEHFFSLHRGLTESNTWTGKTIVWESLTTLHSNQAWNQNAAKFKYLSLSASFSLFLRILNTLYLPSVFLTLLLFLIYLYYLHYISLSLLQFVCVSFPLSLFLFIFEAHSFPLVFLELHFFLTCLNISHLFLLIHFDWVLSFSFFLTWSLCDGLLPFLSLLPHSLFLSFLARIQSRSASDHFNYRDWFERYQENSCHDETAGKTIFNDSWMPVQNVRSQLLPRPGSMAERSKTPINWI